jgi:hypothetical protein
VFWPHAPGVSTVLQAAGLLTHPYPGAFPFLSEQWLKNARVVIKDTQQRELLVNFTPFPIILFQEPFARQIYDFNGKI